MPEKTPAVRAAGSDRLRVGLIGAGGRGRGAAKDCVEAAEGVEIVSVAESHTGRFLAPLLTATESTRAARGSALPAGGGRRRA